MALPLANTFESGQADTTTITTGNSGGGAGDAWTNVTIAAGGGATYSTAITIHGALAGRFVNGTAGGSATFTRWEQSVLGSISEVYGRLYVYLPAAPGSGFSTMPIMFSESGVADRGAIGFKNSVGNLRLRLFQTSGAVENVGSVNLAAATLYRIEHHFVCSATVGVIHAKIFAGESTTPLEEINWTGRNTGTAINQLLLGCTTGEEGAGSFVSYIDSVQANATGFPGPFTTAQFLRPSADSADGNWTNQAGNNTNLFDSINETAASDSDYIQSEIAPASSGTRIKLATGTTPGAGTRYFRWRIGKDATGGATINMTARIREDATLSDVLGTGTLVQEFTRNGVDAATTFEETITGSVTNYANLYVEFLATQA